jgi:hypothetical protein
MKLRTFLGTGFMAALAAPEICRNLAASNTFTAPKSPTTVSVSADKKTWYSNIITAEQLASAQYNPQTHQRELTVSMEIPDCVDPCKFVVTSGQLVGVYLGTFPDPEGGTNLACMMIVAIIIIVVGGVIIYQLVKLCRTVLNPPKKDNNDQ